MSSHVLERFNDRLKSLHHFSAVRSMQYGYYYSPPHLVGILEWYFHRSCSFYKPIGEIRMALHEMYEVSGLPNGDYPYEEYIPAAKELDRLKETNLLAYNILKVMCHLFICARAVKLEMTCHVGEEKISHPHTWAKYLFPRLDEKKTHSKNIRPLQP